MKSALVSVILTVVSVTVVNGCGAPSARDSTTTSAGRHVDREPTLGETSSVSLNEALREGMTEIEVASSLAVTDIDEKRYAGCGPLASKMYVCRGNRFPSKLIKCKYEMVWDDESKDLAAWKLKEWGLVVDEATIAELDLEPVGSDYAVNRVRWFAEGLRAAREAEK